MDNNAMNHSGTDHSMHHSNMDHSKMDHSMSGHDNMVHGNISNSNSSMHGNMSKDMDHSMHGGDMSGMSGMSGMDHTGHGGHMGMSGMHMDMPGMKMYFHTGVKEYVLFKDCFTTSEGALFAACVVMFVAGIMYEGIKFLREMLLQKSLQRQMSTTYIDPKTPASSQEQIVVQTGNSMSRILSSSHLIQTLLHVVQVFVSYCLMLVFMTYNVWLCLAVILGAGAGYFIFGWKRAVVVDANEHCH